jgi:predicted CoA-binding protein
MSSLKDAALEFLSHRRIAVAGVSRDKPNAANVVYRKLKAEGYDVFAVNPAADQVEGDRCYRSLAEIAGGVDGVVVGSHPGTALAIVQEAAAAGVRRVWLHKGPGTGSVSAEAVSWCKAHDVAVIAGACPMMYVAHADFGHRCMCWLLDRFGKLPDAHEYQAQGQA